MDKKQMKFPVAAILFTIMAPLSMIAIFTTTGATVAVALFTTVAYILLAISLYMKKRGVLLIIGTAFCIFSTLILVGDAIVTAIQVTNYGYSTPYVIYYVITCFSYLVNVLLWAIILLVILALSEKLGAKLQKIAKKVWFIPLILLFLSDVGLNVLFIVIQIMSYSMYTEIIIQLLVSLISYSFTVTLRYLSFFLMLMWVRNPYRKQVAQPAQPVYTQPVSPVQPVQQYAQPEQPVQQPVQYAQPVQPVYPAQPEQPPQPEYPPQQ